MSESIDADTATVIDTLRSIHRTTGHSMDRVFRDWTALATLSFARDDDTYLDRLDRYDGDRIDEETHREVVDAFAEALGEVIAATAAADRPVIGDVYEAIGADSDALGQHFTPWPLCQMKAGMIIDSGDVARATADDPVTVADPAVGSARLLVAAAKTAHRQVAGRAPMVVQGTDTDRTCARMAVINLVIAGVRGRIRHGNSLTGEMWRAWIVDPVGPGPNVRIVEDPADTTPSTTDSAAEAEADADADPESDTEPTTTDADTQAGLDVFVGGED